MEKINLHDVIKQVTDSFNYTLKETGGHIDLRLDSTHSIIWADKTHLANVIYNLLDNAFKYKKEKPEILITTSNEDHKIKLLVKDNGMGIDKKYIHKIFDKFYRIPTGDVHNVKGFGIGLNYVKNIVDNHKWKINVRSEHGVGSTFKILIPETKDEN